MIFDPARIRPHALAHGREIAMNTWIAEAKAAASGTKRKLVASDLENVIIPGPVLTSDVFRLHCEPGVRV